MAPTTTKCKKCKKVFSTPQALLKHQEKKNKCDKAAVLKQLAASKEKRRQRNARAYQVKKNRAGIRQDMKSFLDYAKSVQGTIGIVPFDMVDEYRFDEIRFGLVAIDLTNSDSACEIEI